MNSEVYRRYMNLFYGLGKSAAQASVTAKEVLPKVSEETATEATETKYVADGRFTNHGKHRVMAEKTYGGKVCRK